MQIGYKFQRIRDENDRDDERQKPPLRERRIVYGERVEALVAELDSAVEAERYHVKERADRRQNAEYEHARRLLSPNRYNVA